MEQQVSPVLKQNTKNIIADTKRYFTNRKRGNKPKSCNNNEHCNQYFKLSDTILADLANRIVITVRSGRLYAYGVKLQENVGNGSGLRRRCCNCRTGDGIQFRDKNRIRAHVENFIDTWRLEAERWMVNGCKPLTAQDLQTKPIFQRAPDNTVRIGTKRIS